MQSALRMGSLLLSTQRRALRLLRPSTRRIAAEANLPTSSLTIALPGVGDDAGLIATIFSLARGEHHALVGHSRG